MLFLNVKRLDTPWNSKLYIFRRYNVVLKHNDTLYNVHNIANLFVSSSVYSFPMVKRPPSFLLASKIITHCLQSHYCMVAHQSVSFLTYSLAFLPNFPFPPLTQPLAAAPPLSSSVRPTFYESAYEWNHVYVWLISYNIMTYHIFILIL